MEMFVSDEKFLDWKVKLKLNLKGKIFLKNWNSNLHIYIDCNQTFF